MTLRDILEVVLVLAIAVTAKGQIPRTASPIGEFNTVERLADEVRVKGWIVFCARSDKGDWDLFLCRPDGSRLLNITNTFQYNEAAPQFSRDGRRLLYRRLARNEQIDGNRYGTQGQLILANSDGTDMKVLGRAGEYAWASWNPDGKQIACLSIAGVFFVDIASHKTVQEFDRKGFFQQLTLSPDGDWLCGVANSFGTGWSIARMSALTGEANAVSRVDCCTPDWFPDGKHIVFSNRPPGQKANNGYGWTQLWMADAEGKTRRLLYAEDGRHIYGGCISPDEKYVLFTGNIHEDGDPGNRGAPMNLMRLADAPVIKGPSEELREWHPDVNDGPVLELPVGWEPCWTAAEIGMDADTSPQGTTSQVAALAHESHNKGWIVFSAETTRGDWDLFLMRPDGSDRRQITNTPDYNEAGARFSPDGKKLLYYRLPGAERIDNNTYGTYELVIADSDGGNAITYGNRFKWASWGPHGKQIASLDMKAIQIIDLATRQVVRELPRKRVVQQLVWSPDGKWFVGTANGMGVAWAIGRLSAETGQINPVSETDRYNCTPDWLTDSQRVVYSRGIVPGSNGWAELWVAAGSGGGEGDRQLLYAEDARHIYGGCISPDGKYVLFTRSEEDLGKVDNSRTRMAIIRWSDTPVIGGDSESLHAEYPNARNGPVLDLSWGWEPHWTYSDVVPTSGSDTDVDARLLKGYN